METEVYAKYHKGIEIMRKFFVFLTGVFLSVVFSVFAELPIQTFYWKPSDVKMPSQEDLDVAVEAMGNVQSFFASEMERYGFGPKTFDFHPIQVIEAKLERREYQVPLVIHKEAISVIERGLDNQIYVVFLGGDGPISRGSAASQKLCANIPEQLKYCNNLVVVPAENSRLLEVLLAHELGHAFSLEEHPPIRLIENRIDVMYFPLVVVPGVKEELKKYAFNRQDATFLDRDGRLSIQVETPALASGVDADVNNDGYVDLSDVRIVRSAIQNRTSYDTDVNGDGITNEIDVLIVKAKAMEALAAAAPSQPRKRTLVGTWGALKRRR